MSPVEDGYAFACPHCSAEISIAVDYTAGRRQAFTYDCEVCCRPIAIRLEVSGQGVTSFSAEPES
ncbi:MAG: CPXCG motif-containing cysteine-rich protein [Candidatus Omnitrophica bacterium]|nr:CPXCG motif-containing cysteine-rich protein [Candidatus Omnitrophota bacterium]